MVAKYMNRQNIIRSISSTFPIEWHNATKFCINPVKSALQNRLFSRINQVLMAITLASISGIGQICRIAAFSYKANGWDKPRVFKAMWMVKE
ncbi:MAG: hypothetical protein A2X05_08155 [Bacteroidetes bacterium GWE2_41_25]|nr:MAG: hypothetical protein A2X03_00405 [Bacteroidetes bacterium GWA2_40_15]OFX93330.1 MAG: hypothetical protein A2X05_08155 [Bacteroidetes bacterium GWE2_41_25]OFX97785.1 MAG: hypothetical protein A2X06_06010 [Bacteroidetes bacterium GWC2_40_22]OFY60791.1 MAG: hypothetical protein A2X04_01500 [Bacteroidetes bacterium GWF2_41_9]HBH83789.1 hypothetical protein [Bacteroidales bacterium]